MRHFLKDDLPIDDVYLRAYGYDANADRLQRERDAICNNKMAIPCEIKPRNIVALEIDGETIARMLDFRRRTINRACRGTIGIVGP